MTDLTMVKYQKYKFYGLILMYLFSMLRASSAKKNTSDSSSEETLSPQRMWDPEKNAIIGLTENPQQMWDPKKGSIVGIDFGPSTIYDKTASVTNETVQVGSNIFMNCQVRNMADKKVSWIRRRDNHILTSGMNTYTNDERFSVVRAEGSDNWALLIRFVQERDAGRYDCQVSTKTGRYGHSVELHVVIPMATIAGSSELHVQSGSTISLLCIIKDVLEPPHFVLWYHNNKIINHSQTRSGITIQTEFQPKITSQLIITGAAYDESGNYTCKATDTKPASVIVFISEGDKTAAIHRLGSGGTRLKTDLAGRESHIFYIFLLFIIHFHTSYSRFFTVDFNPIQS